MLCKLVQPANPATLQRNRLFAGFDLDVISRISPELDMVHYDGGDVIFYEGDPGDCLYLVCEGEVKISKRGRGGREEALGHIQTGNFFGEMALLDGKPRSATATACKETVLGRVDSNAFTRILELAPREAQLNFLKTAVERLRGVNDHFIGELMRSERLSLVGTMANSIIHDLRNPMCAIRSCAELLASKNDEASANQFVGIIHKSLDRMSDMIQELLDFARGQTNFSIQRQSISSVMEEVESTLLRIIPQNVYLMREYQTQGDISVDLGKIVRVLLNLCKNSIEAMPSGGLLTLTVRRTQQHILFRVSDSGCGIPPELQSQVFEPFVTSGKAKGTGLGMAIAKSVVEGHGGAIALRSTVGVGTTVEIAIPVDPGAKVVVPQRI